MSGAYRRRGADPPLRDPGGHHGVAMEGYYWRIAHRPSGRVVVALCGVLSGHAGAGGLVAVSGSPRARVRSAVAPEVTTHPRRVDLDAGVLRATADALHVRVDDAAVEAAFAERRTWPRALGALGVAHLVPGLGQYWHPVLLGARVSGWAEIGGARIDLDGASAYIEKNWGPAFPERWWWGQALEVGGADVCVAFAGGLLRAGPIAAAATGLVVRIEDRVIRMVPPGAVVRAQVDGRVWRLRAIGPRTTIDLVAEPGVDPPAHLPVPAPRDGGPLGQVHQHLRGRLRVRVRRGRRLLIDGTSELAGLEFGDVAA